MDGDLRKYLEGTAELIEETLGESVSEDVAEPKTKKRYSEEFEKDLTAVKSYDIACNVCDNIDGMTMDQGLNPGECNPIYCDWTDVTWPGKNTCRPKACCDDSSC